MPSDSQATHETPTVVVGDTTFRLPFADLLPPLDDSDLSTLRGDIAARQAVIVPIVIDEARNVIDGANRASPPASASARCRLKSASACRRQRRNNSPKTSTCTAGI